MRNKALIMWMLLALTSATAFAAEQKGGAVVVHQFNGTDGAYPAAGLSADAAGNLYGTTQTAGAFND